MPTRERSRRRHASLPRTLIALIVALGLPACRNAESDDAVRTIRIYDLLKVVPKAKVQSSNADYVAVRTGRVGDEEGSVLFMHPVSSVEFLPIDVGPDAVLAFAIGITQEAWGSEGDGVEFKVEVKGADPAQSKMFLLFSRYIDPKHRVEDRRWISARVPLRRFAGQAVQLVFSTSGGPAQNTDFDWAVWREPQILLDGQ